MTPATLVRYTILSLLAAVAAGCEIGNEQETQTAPEPYDLIEATIPELQAWLAARMLPQGRAIRVSSCQWVGFRARPNRRSPRTSKRKQNPFGISFAGLPCSEPRLIALASAFEQATLGRVPPPGAR